LGKERYIGGYSSIRSKKGSHIIIGKKCGISHNFRIYNASKVTNQDFSSEELKNYSKDG
jgi:hypothetical protein